MIGIYKITNNINGKCYIGQSINISRRWKNHKKDAFWEKGPDYEYPLYRAIRKYGLHNFTFEVLEQCAEEELNDKEINYIAQYKSHGPAGYNQDNGGNQAKHGILTRQEVDEIKQYLKTTNLSAQEIGDKFGVARRTISAINTGNSWAKSGEQYPIRTYRISTQHRITRTRQKKGLPKTQIKNFCKICGKTITYNASFCQQCGHDQQQRTTRPEPLVLAKIVIEQGFEEAGRQFSVSGKTISKWFKSWGLPNKKQGIADWYYKETKQVPPQKQIIERKPLSEIMTPVRQIDITTREVINTFPSAAAAVRFLNRGQSTHITEVCKGRRKTAYGYVWEFV